MLTDEEIGFLLQKPFNVARVINLYAIAASDRIIQEFMCEVIAEKFDMNDLYIDRKDVNVFFALKATQDEGMRNWSESTMKKLKSSIINIFYEADNDNVIPILADEYFEDDIVTRFVEFVKATFGTETIEQNLDFIADTLGRKGSETSKDTIRRYFVNDFYKDHVQIYKKRPIYWMFSSGKEKAFNCLVYLHRYNQDTVATIRTDYVHRLQETLEVEKRELVRLISQESGTKEGRAAAKKLERLEKQMKELHVFEEKVHHFADLRISLDLDDGVKVNYQKLGELLIDIGLKKDKGE